MAAAADAIAPAVATAATRTLHYFLGHYNNLRLPILPLDGVKPLRANSPSPPQTLTRTITRAPLATFRCAFDVCLIFWTTWLMYSGA